MTRFASVNDFMTTGPLDDRATTDPMNGRTASDPADGDAHPKDGEFSGKIARLVELTATPADSRIGFLDSGDRAELRRITVRRPIHLPPAFWKVVCASGINVPSDDESELAWGAIVNGIALTADDCLGARYDFGYALAIVADDATDRRFDALLSASRDRYTALLGHILRYAASKKISFNWTTLARLTLAKARRNTPRSSVETYVNALARSYYTTRTRLEHSTIRKEGA